MDFFRALDMPAMRGIIPPDVTVDQAPRQVVVNQAFARDYFAGQDPVGRRIELLPINEPTDPSRHRVYEVAAVVGTSATRDYGWRRIQRYTCRGRAPSEERRRCWCALPAIRQAS